MGKTVYIAGKITGLPQQLAKERFHRAEQELAAMGYQVVSPASLYKKDKSWEDAMRENIRYMLDCDEVHLLPGWQESRGAQLERDIAIRLGMNVVYH